MRKLLLLTAAVASVLLLGAVSLVFPPQAVAEPSAQAAVIITDTPWLLVSYSDTTGASVDALPDVRVTATFDALGKVTGLAGCNVYSAPYEATGTALTVGMAVTTMKMCPTPIMDQEAAFLKNLQAAATYEIADGNLAISDAQGAVVLVLAPEPPGLLTGVNWQMTSYNNGRGGFQSAMADVQVTALFAEDGSLTGNGGCNNYSASYTVDGDKIAIGAVAATRMACEPPVMEQETAYFNALAEAAVYKIEGDQLTLRSESDAAMAGYVRTKDVVQPEAAQPEAAQPEAAQPEAPSAPTGDMLYVSILPAADASVRSIALNLKADGTAGMLTDFGDGKLINQAGTWAENADGTLTLTLVEQDGKPYDAAQVLTFERDDAYLTLVDFDKSVWGEQGLRLNQAADVARKVRSAMVTLDLAAGFPLDPTFVSVHGGGEVDARLLGRGCSGFINQQPVVKVRWSGEAERVRAFFYSDGDPTLVILTPDGKLLCNDNATEQLLDPFVELEKPVAGEYRIWVGSAAKNQLIPGVLVLSAKSDMDLGTFQLGNLIKRPSIPQQVVRSTTAMKLSEQVQAVFDKLVKDAPALQPGFAPVTVDVTVEGELPLFRLPNAEEKGCAGLVTGAPSYAFKWQGQAPNLHIAFEGDGDATLMVVGVQSRRVLCNDDATADSVNPAIDVPEPADDTYLVYVGRINPEKPILGKLTVTEGKE